MSKKSQTVDEILQQVEGMEIPKLAQILPMVAGVKTTPERRRILATKCLPQAVLWTETKKAEYAGVDRKTLYNAERDPKFRQLAIDFIRARTGKDVPEIWSSYITWAKLGDRHRQERILEQAEVLDKPEKSGDTNLSVVVTVEQKQQLERKRVDNQSRGLESLGYTLHTDN